jgi:hypothetical protein
LGAKRRARGPKHAAATAPEPAARGGRARAWRVGAALFALALAMRVLFWQATPDRSWPWSAWYKGDAPVWLDYAQSLQAGRAFELGLPIHPPGAGYLVAALWNGRADGVAGLRFAWALMGALVVVLVAAAALRSFGGAVAAMTGWLCAVSGGLLVLGSSINNEVPYLLLVAGALVLWEDARAGRTPSLAAFGALNAVACLFRVEHLLCFVLFVALLALAWRRAGWTPAAGRTLLLVAAFAVPLVPWHVAAWNGIERFNEGPRAVEPGQDAAIGQVERALAGVAVRPEAAARREELPAFLRRPASVFVAATVAHRGGREVRAEDFGILEDAFGYVPRPLARRPFVSSYGPLNFYLANRPGGSGGFDRSPLEEPPPLLGGRERYPAFLVQGLPPADLSFVYPPHLRLYNDGYRLGGRAVRERPGAWLALCARKLRIFGTGAALGLGGFGLPLGQTGLRRAVDLVVPRGPLATAWRVLVLGTCVAGLAAGWKRPGLAPWLALLASKVVATVLFFGYARQGATMTPVVALLAALAIERWVLPRVPRVGPPRAAVLASIVLATPVLLEAARWLRPPAVTIDGRAIGPVDPFPAREHRDQAVDVR